MHILYISQTLPPEPGATHRPLKQAVQLQRLGHRVTLLSTMPYYPVGRIYPGYRGQMLVREELEGVAVIRVPSIPAANTGTLRRVASYLSFAASAGLCAYLLPKPDLVIASVPHLGTELAALTVARRCGCPSLLELRDLLPDALTFTGISPTSKKARALSRYMSMIYGRFTLISAPSDTMVSALVARGVPANSVLKLPHGFDDDLLQSPVSPEQTRETLGIGGTPLVVYLGSFSRYYDVPNIALAAKELLSRGSNAHVLLGGCGADFERVREIVRIHGLTNVSLPGSLARDQIKGYLAAADLCITSTVGTRSPASYFDYLATKACEYLGAGKKVLAVENAPIAGRLLEREEMGKAVPARDPMALANAIDTMLNDGKRHNKARTYALANLKRDKIVQTFERELRRRLEAIRTAP